MSTIKVKVQRIINLGNYRSLHLGGSIESPVYYVDDAQSDEKAEAAFMQRLVSLVQKVNNYADQLESDAKNKGGF
jgi:hypothetical protein